MEAAPLYTDVAEAPKGGRAYFVKTTDGTRIRFALWVGGHRGLALVFPGRTECIEKYGQMAESLKERGFSVLIIDWRGQGLSDRLNNSTAVGHVESFENYQQDIDAVLSHPEVLAISAPKVLFAHSMGGCIGLQSLLKRSDITLAVFSAPMWGLHLKGANKFLAPMLANIGVALGMGKKMIFGQPKGFYLTRAEFDGNELTNDANFWAYMREQIIKYPALALGSPSYKWLQAALKEFPYFVNTTMPNTPTLTFVGSAEAVVSREAIQNLMPKFANGKLVEIAGGRHEIWMETPERQAACWAEIDAFLAENLPI